jgi:drug/metabolite transporter (DMT)-like permease
VKSPALRGTVIALASAVLFGVTTPLVQRLGRGVGPFVTAALLYAGAAMAGALGRSQRESPPTRAHFPRIAAMAIAGAAIAPALLAWGLGRTSGTAASLMLNLEAVFTIALARLMFKEHVGRRVAIASLVLLAAGALLVIERTRGGGATSAVGLGCVAAASLAWAFDNALSKPLSALDPSAVVAAKGAAGAALSFALAFAVGDAWPPPARALGLLAVGATGYGLSLRLYLLAQRALGAGRTASVFASAPFCGALLALTLGEPAGALTLAGAIAMIAGLLLHATEQHEHAHTHRAIDHEHPHRHDDGHHDHAHDPMPAGEHTHAHRHEPVAHSHPHVPDLHHEHDHEH